MGFPIAGFLSQKHHLLVWNRTESKVSTFLEKYNAESRKTPRETIIASHVTFIALWDAQSIETQIFGELNDEDFKNRTFINICTVSPEESKNFFSRTTKLGGKWIESPLLGNNKVVEAGKVICLIGGNKEECEEYFALFSLFGTPKYLGNIGSATSTKLALNAFLATYSSAFASSFSYLESCNVDVDMFCNILQAGPFNVAGGYYNRWTNLIKSKNFSDDVAFTLSGISKDCSLAIDEMKSHNIDASVFEGAHVLIQKAINSGNADKDMSVVYLETKKNED